MRCVLGVAIAWVGWALLPVRLTADRMVAHAMGGDRRPRQYQLPRSLRAGLRPRVSHVRGGSIVGRGFHRHRAHRCRPRGLDQLAHSQRDYWTARSTFETTAFPSMHLAEVTHWGVALECRAWMADRLASVVFVALMLVGSVAFGWHYSVDGYPEIIGVD